TCGIVGLPNVGKSTIFNALTNAGAQAANYPFCTIEPNVGVVPLNDLRMKRIAELFKPEKILPTTVEFVDIAGLVKGASTGEGLGNQFLGNIKNVDAIAHIVRCFENADVVHVHGEVDPIRDIEVINTELILADLQAVEKRIEKQARLVKVGDKKIAAEVAVLEKVRAALNEANPIRSLRLSPEEKEHLVPLFLITAKPVLYVCNVDEAHVTNPPPSVAKVQELAAKEGTQVVIICGSIESEIAQMQEEEKTAFLKDYGLTESGLDRLGTAAYRLLNLITYFTAGPKEVRAWTVIRGALAPQAAGVIHSDFEKGFIRAEVYHYDDLIRLGSEQKIKEAGLLRSEGKEYVVKDGDLMHFRFNV
ncbi:MAG TPA: redox-regulated ATPase YchF, partial [Deltaproteobacteria bacterium]|nr:redox-regulated ATPase YchF [Deltaproteobacteria bacterium]